MERLPLLNDGAAAKGKESEEKRRRRERDRKTEDDLHKPAKTAVGAAKGERQAGDYDDDDGDDARDGSFDGIENLLERRFPGHSGAGRVGGAGPKDERRDQRNGRK